ncbi:hypothetical protein HMSSN036_91120 [Paenibacillus macerans]|nr:hypothetical protein HMSSN036_91120 [Paenibacillus macerans]
MAETARAAALWTASAQGAAAPHRTIAAHRTIATHGAASAGKTVLTLSAFSAYVPASLLLIIAGRTIALLCGFILSALRRLSIRLCIRGRGIGGLPALRASYGCYGLYALPTLNVRAVFAVQSG